MRGKKCGLESMGVFVEGNGNPLNVVPSTTEKVLEQQKLAKKGGKEVHPVL